MKPYLIAIAAAAVLTAACSGGSAMVATVNGTEIVTGDVGALIFDPGSDIPDDRFTQLLDILVQWNAIADAAKAEFGIEPTADEIAAEVDRLYTEQGLGATFEEYLESENISEEGLDQYAAQLLIGNDILLELQASVEQSSEAEARQLLLDDPAAWTEVCAAHILVATAAEATAVLVRLEAGEDFAALAAALSLDAQSSAAGGELGCTSPTEYVPEFAAATLTAERGEVVGPVETQLGFHLIRVNSRAEATTEQLQSRIYDQRVAAAVNTWYRDSVGGADVVVSEEWGTWVTDPFPSIVAPES